MIPSDLSGLMLWLDASDSGTITHSGGAVSQWDDKSGNANHAAQSTAGMKPTTNSVTLNGLNVLSFDGGDSMTCTSVDLTGGGQKFTVFAVFSASTGGYQFVLEHTAEYSANPGAFVLRRDGVSDAGYLCKQGSGIRSSCSTASSITAAACLSATHDGTLSTNETTVWRNGTAGTLRTFNANTSSGNLNADMLIGGRSTYFLTGTIAEIVVYAALLDTSDRQAIEFYLTSKWLADAVVPVDTSNANTADVATVGSTTAVTPVDTSNANTADAATVASTVAVSPVDTSNANTSDAATVTDLTPPPTPAEIVESEWVQVDAGLDLLDEDGVFVMDISADLQVEGSSVARVMGNRIHGTCDLVIARRLLWGSQRVRPKMTLTNADGDSMTWNLGVYALTTPSRVAGETPETYKVSGFDLLSFLDNPYGSTYSAAVGAVPLTLIATILTALGITNGIDQTAIGSTLATAKVWPLDQKNTTLLIVNELLALIGYGPLWIDRDGRARSGPLTATTATMWTYSADSATTTVGETRTQTADFWGVPNRWVFVRNGTTSAPSEGGGVYTVENVSDGESSQTGRGRVINRVEFLDAVDQTALVAQGDAIVASDRRVVSTISMNVAPNPEHWHADRATYTDSALGVSGEFKVVEWRLPLDGSDMSLELEAV